MNKTIEKKEVRGSKKSPKKSMQAIIKNLEKLNRAPLKTKPPRKSKSMIMAEWIEKNSGLYSKKEIVEKLHEECGIVPGTGGTIFSELQNPKYRPAWFTKTLTVDENKKVCIS